MMKIKRNLVSVVTIIAVCLLAFNSCKEETTNPCDDTVAAAKSITFNITVKVEDESGNPISNEVVEIRFERHPCGKSAEVMALYEANTDQQGEIMKFGVTITLHNTADDAFVTATAINLVSSKNWTNRTYKYNEFENGDTKDLLLTIKKE